MKKSVVARRRGENKNHTVILCAESGDFGCRGAGCVAHRVENKNHTVILGENRCGCVAERVEFSGAEVLVAWHRGE